MLEVSTPNMDHEMAHSSTFKRTSKVEAANLSTDIISGIPTSSTYPGMHPPGC